MSPTKLIAARDPNGFRPLCMGKIGDGRRSLPAKAVRWTPSARPLCGMSRPGEIVVVDKEGVQQLSRRTAAGKGHACACLSSSILPGPIPSSTARACIVARLRAGAFLALEHPVQADVVIGVPDSGLDAAMGYSRQSGIPYGIGFIKNKYIGRTFIQPTQKQRRTPCASS